MIFAVYVWIRQLQRQWLTCKSKIKEKYLSQYLSLKFLFIKAKTQILIYIKMYQTIIYWLMIFYQEKYNCLLSYNFYSVTYIK